MNGRILAINELRDLSPVARDLSELLPTPENRDIELEFPGTLADFGNGETRALRGLQRIVANCEKGRRESFVVCSDDRAVGVALITVDKHPPKAVDPSWPNVSGYVAHPYRGRGLGRLSLQKRLEVVQNNFGGHAWTLVNKTNLASEAMVMSVGFQPVAEKVATKPGYNLFIYEAITDPSRL